MTPETHQPPYPNKVHELKSWPEFFKETKRGRKRFELRYNDRDYHVGDTLILKEWVPDHHSLAGYTPGYTGDQVTVRVDYILFADDTLPLSKFQWPLHKKFVIMGVSLI